VRQFVDEVDLAEASALEDVVVRAEVLVYVGIVIEVARAEDYEEAAVAAELYGLVVVPVVVERRFVREPSQIGFVSTARRSDSVSSLSTRVVKSSSRDSIRAIPASRASNRAKTRSSKERVSGRF
jgi:hypothetical protein